MAFVLLFADSIVAYLTIGAAIESTGFEFTFGEAGPKRNNDVDWTVPVVALCVLVAICWLSAWPLFRKGFYLSGVLQIIFGSGLLILLAVVARS
ncbi:hypothetical protein [Streptomyces sp. NPDC007100]|uniref:hypothetical protein n=1 Tax=Streptomyces sp. NPDC007100 TaxID=3155602 RepID=UPI003401B711